MQGDTALEIESGGKKTTVAIVDGANFRKWPTDILPVQYGADYRLSGGGLAQPVTVRFTAMESAPDTVERSEEHTSELQSLMRISYAVFCLKKKNNNIKK